MKITPINSDVAPKAIGRYSQAVLVERPDRLLYVSGQIPVSAKGAVPSDFESQCRLAWANVLAQLNAAQMTVSNLTKVTIFLSSRKYAEENRRIRQEVLGSHQPALTVIITGIFDEGWLIEIDAYAAA
ncbi:MAG TPA: RidA family protein [Woeseiaceae bacterium]|nr:RidA family protein [Woeseiaceae bacterium]